jgi:hypothetical protein
MAKGKEIFTRGLQIEEGQNKATIAVAREMVVIIYQMLSNKESYRGMKESLATQKYKRIED